MKSSSAPTQTSSNAILEVLRLKNDHQSIGPLQPARSRDAEKLQGIARRISSQALSSRMLLLTTGFGLHRSLEVPVRLPALILPGLRVMEKFQDAGLDVPEYVLYQATDFIAETNRLPHLQARVSGARMAAYLQGYIQTFHARIAKHVRIRFGEPFGDVERERIAEGAQCILEKLSRHPEIDEALKGLRTSEERHSNDTNKAVTYASANAYYSGALASHPFCDEGVDERIMIPIGGRPEKPFFAITSAYADGAGGRTLIPMFTMLGSRPTYFHYPDSKDPLAVEALSEAEQHIDGPIRMDLRALCADGATPEILRDIYPRKI